MTDATLGADIGGSKTTIVITDADGRERARAEGPGGAMRPGGADRSAAVILEAARRAAQTTGVDLPVSRAVLGIAGAGRETERAELEHALVAAGLARSVRVLGDVELALHAAFSGGPGLLIAAGTGSAAVARDAAGKVHRAGGYGWQLGDEGGGYWLGRRALLLAGREHDGIGPRSTLPTRLLQALTLRTFDDLVRWTATATPPQVAALAPRLLDAATDGEPIAQAAVDEAARALADLAVALATRFADDAAIDVATTGSLLGPGALRTALRRALAAALPRARLVDVTIDAALAAARLAP